MTYHVRSEVKENEEFRPENYPPLRQELIKINEKTVNMPHTFKAEIVISFTKDHFLENEWIKANPEFARLVATGALPLKNIEALFEASTGNSFFQQQFETYLKTNMKGTKNQQAFS